MTGIPGGTADAAQIHDAFAVDCTIGPAGGTHVAIRAVRSDRSAESFQGPGHSVREVSFEILKADHPTQPGKSTTLVDELARVWRTIEVVERDDIDAWHLIVERVS